MIRRLPPVEACMRILHATSDDERVQVATYGALSVRGFASVRNLRGLAQAIERHADDLECAHDAHLQSLDRRRISVLPGCGGHLAPEARKTASGVFYSNTPAWEPLTELDPVCGGATGGTLPMGTRPSPWSRLVAWSNRVDRSWTGAIIGGVSLFGGAYLLFVIAGVLQ